MISNKGLKLINYISDLTEKVENVRAEAFDLSVKFQAVWDQADKITMGEIDEDEHDVWVTMGDLIEEMIDGLDTFHAISGQQTRNIIDALPEDV